MKSNHFKRSLSMLLAVVMLLSCWVWTDSAQTIASAAGEAIKDKFLFAYFTGNSSDGQTVHLAVSEDGLHYTALRNNEPVIIPSKGTGAVRDPYLWYNEQDNYYYLICTDMDSVDNQWWDNCNGFLMWRSKDLVHWYDETFINVYDMLQKFDQKVGIVHRAWAPQILWDGQSYVVYFSIDTDNVNYPADQLSIVYLKTNDLMDLSQYYEYGGIFYPGSDVNDADIIQHPTNGKWYLFYKPEATTEYPTTKINMMVADNATGPYTSADPNNSRGLDIFSTINEGLEGGNGYFDNEGNFVMYADAYGRPSAYFYIAKTPANGDFKNWTVYGEEAHNINSLSPRHGSVVKITDEEYNRLLNNAYGITSSSFPATETLSDHLVGRYFTTSDNSYNAANGQNDLTVVGDMPMNSDYEFDKIGYYAYFTGAPYAKINMRSLFPNGIDYNDGFTITFTALIYGNADSRFYSISDGTNTTNFAVNGNSSGAYVVNNEKVYTTSTNLADGALHEFAVSYANGNIIVYKDGELFLKKNRFNDGVMTEDWFNALSNGTLYIGALGDNSGIAVGGLADFCIYDCALSYYDIKNIQNEQDIAAGLISNPASPYSGFVGVAPSFKSDEGAISTNHYANILYSPKLDGTLPEEEGEDKANPDSNQNRNQAAVSSQNNNTNVGIYYAKETVMFVDGISTPKMPVLLAARLNTNNYDDKMETAYPTVSATNSADNANFYLTQNWYGWTRYPNFTYAITNPDGSSQRVGHNSSTKLSADLDNANTQGNRSVYYYASVLALNTNNVTFNSSGYQKYNLSWLWDSQQTSGYNEAAPNNNIWVVDLRGYVTARNQIASEYESIVKNSSYCPASIANYKAIVEILMQFNPNSYNYAGGVEAAVKACSTEAQKLVSDYNTVKAQLGACKKVTVPGREVSCVVNGLTEGSYCEFCGEVYAEQQIIPAPFYHTFGEKFQENGKFYVQCSTCGIKILVQEHEVRYENLFSFNDWYDSDSKNANNSGAITPDFKKDTIIFKNGGTSGESVSGASGNVSRNTNMYSIPVNPGQTYVLEYTLVSQDATSDIFIFYYNVKNEHVGTYGGVVSGTNGASKTYTYQFTPVAGAAYAELRFDSNDTGETVKFASIGVYEKENYDTYAKENPYARLGFDTGDNSALYTPKRIGYEFLGWYTNAGRKITNTNQLTSSVTVYAKWREIGNSVNYNGNLFSLTDFAKSNDYNMQSSVLDGHVYADFANGTFYTVSARDGLGKADLAVNSQLDTYNTPGSYKVPVTAGKEYVFTTTLANKTAYQCYLWFYNASGGAVTHPATNAQWINHSTNNSANGAVASWNGTTLVIRFTAPTGATHVSFRLGTTGQYAFTQSFSNIGLYESADYDGYVKNSNCPAMTYVPTGADVPLAIPSIENWTFEAWYTGRNGTGDKFTTTVGMTSTQTVFAKWKAKVNVTFDNLIDINSWNKVANNGVVSDITDTGFTLTSNGGAGEATVTSHIFPVEAGKSYKVDVDVTGKDWDVYVFFYNATTSSGTGLEFNDTHNRYSSNGSGNSSRLFTAPSGAVRAVIRLDSNGSNNTVRFETIRVYENNGISVSPVNKIVESGATFGTLPIPTRYGYDFDGWYDGNSLVTETTTVAQTSTVFLTSKWTLNNSALVSDAYVLDFGLAVEMKPLENDTVLTSDGGNYSISGISKDGGNTASNSVQGEYGTFTVKDANTVRYVPTKTMDGPEVIYYHVSYNNGAKTLVNTITVIPATVVYYEDDVKSLINYIDGKASSGTTGTWDIVGESKTDSAVQSVADDVYGYDDVYAKATDTYSMGSAHMVSVSQKNNPQAKYNGVAENAGSWPVAQFTFAGTGFDVVSLISQDTGLITVKVFAGTDVTKSAVKTWAVDTYYGYTYTDGDWTVTENDSNALYQIPVIGVTDLDYGTYTVQIEPTYTSLFDHKKDNSYDFCLDAIRVYNPCEFSAENSSIYGKYAADGEYALENKAIRDILINAGDLDATKASTGVVYINAGKTEGTFEDYSKTGPKNEVYLDKGQSIAFNMTVKGSIPTSVQISAHALNGTASMRFGSGSDYSDAINISHKTTMYYEIPFMGSSYWHDNGDGSYTTNSPIVITNNGDGLLSLCNIKVTSEQLMQMEEEPVMFMMSRRSFAVAAEIAEDMSGLSPEDGALFIPDSVEAETDAETVVVGGNVVVTVTTSGDVASLTVNGENADLVSENEDGTKTWSFTYTADSNGAQTITLVAFNEYGYASESTELTVDVESRFEHFFTQLKNFFNMIVEFFKSLFNV